MPSCVSPGVVYESFSNLSKMKFKLITPSHLEQHLALWGINLQTVFWLCDIKMRFYCRFFSSNVFLFIFQAVIHTEMKTFVFTVSTVFGGNSQMLQPRLGERNHVWFNYVQPVNETFVEIYFETPAGCEENANNLNNYTLGPPFQRASVYVLADSAWTELLIEPSHAYCRTFIKAAFYFISQPRITDHPKSLNFMQIHLMPNFI